MRQPSEVREPPKGGTTNWPHRMAVLLVCATFPLIWVGGLVTTTDAGMAVRDWPTTNGYNMFFLPFSQWFGSGWKLFVEHSHRVLGAVTGILTLLFLAAVWLRDGRKWMRWMAVAAVAGVIFQGVLGGFRVIQDERLLAMAHGCTGPLFFALAVVMSVFTSRRWQECSGAALPDLRRPGKAALQKAVLQAADLKARKLTRLALLTTVLVYAQLVLGAQIRHMPATGSTTWFDAAVLFHLLNAAIVLVHGLLLAWRSRGMSRWLTVPAWSVAALLVAQVALGAGTWVVNFGWPQWAQSLGLGREYVVQAQGAMQAAITTGHVAMGSLVLALSALVCVRSARLAWTRNWELREKCAERSLDALRRDSPPYEGGAGGGSFDAQPAAIGAREAIA